MQKRKSDCVKTPWEMKGIKKNICYLFNFHVLKGYHMLVAKYMEVRKQTRTHPSKWSELINRDPGLEESCFLHIARWGRQDKFRNEKP